MKEVMHMNTHPHSNPILRSRAVAARLAPARGFTLIECAIGMLLLSMLLSTLLVPLTAQVEQRKITDTQTALNQIADALMGYAMANGHLPCPDRSSGAGANDGVEDLNPGATNCAVTEGNLPWATLGIAGTDTWGNFFRYRAASTFTDRATPFRLTSTGNITVQCPAAACGNLAVYTSSAPAIVLSHGRNGYGAVNSISRAPNPPPAGADELANSDGNAAFVSRSLSAAGAAAGEYDDLMTWLSTAVLLNKMITAQKLP
jgi:prepilin-type N-terminal cleavage/methylation domain-containing protein